MRIIKLMADYYSFPLWEASPGVVGNVDPATLPISQSLQKSLIAWAEKFDDTINLNDPAESGFPDLESENEFKKMGLELGELLKKELGAGFSVIMRV